MSATPTAWWLFLCGGRGPYHRAGSKLTTFKPSGHWTRSLLPSPDGRKLYVGVGSLTNIADDGMDVEQGRAAIYELDLASGTSRIFAGGLRNAVGLAWEPTTGVLWTVVNERDGLGDETPHCAARWQDAASAACQIEFVDRSPAFLDGHAGLRDLAERADAGIEFPAMGLGSDFASNARRA